MPGIAIADRANWAELVDFLRPRHRGVLVATRASGHPQMSPVTCGLDQQGRLVISTYPERAKTNNVRRNPRVSLCVLSEQWAGPYVQVDGHAQVLDMPAALDGLVDYFRCISGEHPDWQEYREAMARQNKSLIRIEVEHWGPIATGGFPPHLANSAD